MESKKRISAVAAGLIAVILIIMFLLKSCGTTETRSTLKNHNQSSFIAPPLKNRDIAFTACRVPADKDTVLTYKSGSKIFVPAHAFTDRQGNPVNHEITLEYREFHDAWDFFVSGIPMTYTKDSVTCHFESAGMFEIRGMDGNQPVFIAKDKSLHIEMAAKNAAPGFNNYYLDTVQRKWVELGVSEVLQNHRTKTNEDTVSASLLVKIPARPVAPRDADSVINILNINIPNRDNYPELKDFEKLRFEVVEAYGQFRAGKPIQFTRAELIPIKEKPGLYELKLNVVNEGAVSLFDWLVRPAFNGEDYKKAMDIYMKQLKKYNELAKLRKEQQEAFEREMKRDRVVDTIYRTLFAKQFGIYNSDNPLIISWPIVTPEFFTTDGKKIEMQEIIIIDRSINGILRYELTYNDEIQLNTASEQIICGIANDTVFYVVPAKKLSHMVVTSQRCRISLQRINNTTKLEEMIRQFVYVQPDKKL